MSETILFVGARKGLFILRSDAARADWSVEGPLMKGWDIFNVAHDRRHGNRLYAAVGSFVYGATVHVSDDLGRSWRQLANNPRYPEGDKFKVNQIWNVAPGPESEPNTIYAGVDEGGLFISRDNGASWEECAGLHRHPSREEWMPGAGGLCCHTILFDPRNAARMWVGISAAGLYRTDDAGATWSHCNDGIPRPIEGKKFDDHGWCPHKVLVDPANPNHLYRQDHVGVFRSRNAGDTWERIENGLPSRFGFPIVRDPNDGALFIVPQESDEYRFPPDGALRVYRSRDGGDNWEPLTGGLPQEGVFAGVLRDAMDVDGRDPCGIYFGTTGGQVFASADAGESWQGLPCILPRIQSVTAVVND
jgi:photosystem II stability/assembly factor-like uncharacterized protein